LLYDDMIVTFLSVGSDPTSEFLMPHQRLSQPEISGRVR